MKHGNGDGALRLERRAAGKERVAWAPARAQRKGHETESSEPVAWGMGMGSHYQQRGGDNMNKTHIVESAQEVLDGYLEITVPYCEESGTTLTSDDVLIEASLHAGYFAGILSSAIPFKSIKLSEADPEQLAIYDAYMEVWEAYADTLTAT